MAIRKFEESKFEAVPAGLHEAVIYGIVELGTQVTDFQGHVDEKEQILIMFETEEGTISRKYNIPRGYSLKSSLIKIVDTLLGDCKGKDVDFKNLLGKICQINVKEVEGQEGKKYHIVDTVVAAPKKPSIEGKQAYVFFDFTQKELPDGLSKFTVEAIQKSPEYIKKYSVAEVLDI